MRAVVVGIDGSASSVSALDLAAEEAAAHLVPLVIVYAHQPGTRRLVTEDALLDVAVSRALSNHPCLSVSTRLVVGEPCQVLMSWSHDASLLVLGHGCGDGAVPPLAGTVDIRTADAAECPVIVHRPVDGERPVDGPRPVLVGVDGRPGSEPVVEFAFEEAALRGAPVLGMHVCPTSYPGGGNGSGTGGGPGPTEAAQILDTVLAAWSTEYPEVPTVRRVITGTDVATSLAAASLGAQLAVIGSGGHHDRARAANRWTARTMVDRAGCPVAVVPQVLVA